MDRKEALSKGEKVYQGKDCPDGHGGLRYVSNFGCIECLKKHCRKYHFNNHKKNLARLREYAKKDPEGNNRRSKNYFDRKVKAIGFITPKVVKSIKEEQEGKCLWCGRVLSSYHIDHIIPLSKGGSNLESNLCVCCPSCNLSKGSKLPGEWCRNV